MSGPRQDGARTAPGIAVLDGLSEVVDTPCTRLLVARDDAALLGMLTLVLVRLPTGLVGHVEDVVAAEGARGKRPPTTSSGRSGSTAGTPTCTATSSRMMG